MGVIGGAIAEAALEAGHDVKLLCRTSPQGKWNSIGAKFIKGNWYDDNCAVPTVQEGFDVIVDTLIFDSRLMERSAKLVDSHCKQFIYISTDSVYAHPASSLSENTDISLDEINWKYGINKRKAELYLLSHSSDFNFNWSVIRPTITFGDTRIPVGFASKRGTLSLIDRLEKGKPILRFDDGKTRHALCHTSVFGKAAIGLFLNDRAYGRFYHISDDTAYTYDEIFKVLEDITGKKALGVLMGCSGALILILTSAAHSSDKVGDIRGDLLCLFAQFSFALYLSLFNPLIRRYNVFTINKYMFSWATLMLLPFTFSHVSGVLAKPIPTTTWWEVAYVVGIGTFFGYILTMIGQRTLRPTVVSVYNYVQPIVSVAASLLMGIGILKPTHALAVVLVFSGVWLVTKSKSRRDMEAEKEKVTD